MNSRVKTQDGQAKFMSAAQEVNPLLTGNIVPGVKHFDCQVYK